MRDGLIETSRPGTPDGSAFVQDVESARHARLAWQGGHLRAWNLLLMLTPWLLLAVSTVAYFLWVLPTSGDAFRPAGTAVLGLVAAAVLWVLFGHTLPLRNRLLRPASSAIFLVGLLVLCAALMTHSEVFLVFTIAGFFHAYLLKPWPLGVLGVLATSVVLNGSVMRVWDDPASQLVAEFLLVVAVQTAAIGVGVVLVARSEPEERKREELVDRLEAALRENAGLHAQLIVQARESGVQDERQRMASEIHDTLAQGLAGIITQLQAAERAARVRGEAEEHVGRALGLARSSLAEARRSVRALAPGELEQAQLPDALHTLTDRWSKDEGIKAHFSVTGAPEPLSPVIEVSLFRVAQESLTNVAKHAKASRVGVTLSYTGAEVLLDVRDDGRGFAHRRHTGFGLTSMRQRIRGIGGHVDVQSAPGEGTSVSARVPAIAPADAKAQERTDR